MTLNLISFVCCITAGVAIGMYISTQIKKHVFKQVNPKMKMSKKELGIKETYPEFVKKHYTLDKETIEKHIKGNGNISHYYTYIKKKGNDNSNNNNSINLHSCSSIYDNKRKI